MNRRAWGWFALGAASAAGGLGTTAAFLAGQVSLDQAAIWLGVMAVVSLLVIKPFARAAGITVTWRRDGDR